jgi:fructokinase
VLRPHPGGGPFNVAMALGRLEVPVGFLGRLSNDHYGNLLATCLSESGVHGRYILRGAAPTPLAVVHETADGDHEFTFYLAGTAYADVQPSSLPELDSNVTVLCAGTLALATDPPASALEAMLERESSRRLIVVDPNIRPAVIEDQDAFRRRFERIAGFAHVVKLSDADASWLYPGETLERVVEKMLELGAQLAVLTRGAGGASARTRAVSVAVASPTVDVVDTVGAGDSFLAGLLRWLWANGGLSAGVIGNLGRNDLTAGLAFAAAVGALQCSSAGAAPPTLAQVDAFLSRSI